MFPAPSATTPSAKLNIDPSVIFPLKSLAINQSKKGKKNHFSRRKFRPFLTFARRKRFETFRQSQKSNCVH